MLKIEINNQGKLSKIKPFLKQLEKIFHKNFKKPATVSIAIVNKKNSAKFNKEYRGKTGAADILTFVYGEKDAAGEIILCYDKVVERAKSEQTTVLMAAIRLIVHGLFHILGYVHKENKSAVIMERKERGVLRKIKAKYGS